MSGTALMLRSTRRMVPLLRTRWTSGISGGSMGSSWKERERAAEELYFSKRDAEALADLARKMHAQATPSAEKVAKDKDALAALFDKYGVKASDELLDEVVKFKYPGN